MGLISMSIAFFGGPRASPWSGWCYALIGPFTGVHGAVMGKRRRALEAQG
jgi:hypothetical protein